jgi:hypothetical protein
MRRIAATFVVLLGCSASDPNAPATPSDGGTTADAKPPPAGPPGPPGPPGCGLAAAAFCDTFDAPSATGSGGRARELDRALWSAARTVTTPPAYGDVIAIGPATLPACRDGLPATVLPEKDTLVCNTIPTIASNHLLVAAAAQNYGQNSYRVRRPFDFEGRTGTIVFDATLDPGGLLGWVALDVTPAPTPAPSYLKLQNDENAGVPRDGIEIHFNQNCQTTGMVSVSRVVVLHDYQHTFFEPTAEQRKCVSASRTGLNHVEVKLSKTHVEIRASPLSTDGVTFGPTETLFETDVALPFARGYVHLTVHNHATLKYSNDTLDAWIARFDNVGFDGPTIAGWHEAEVPDALVPAGTKGKQNVGYVLGERAKGWSAPLSFSPIDLTGATKAQITLTSWMQLSAGKPSDFVLDWRVNGGPAHTTKYDAAQLAFIAAQPVSGTIPLVLDVPIGELKSGVNTIELATTNVPLSYPPAVYNLDLITY